MSNQADSQSSSSDYSPQNNNNDRQAGVEPEQAHEVMTVIMQHYIDMTKMIRGKIRHAHTATIKRIEDLNNSDDEQETGDKFKRLERLWTQLVEILETYVEPDELEKIDRVFEIIPPSIKSHYKTLVAMDRELTDLIVTIEDPHYQKELARAKTLTARIQKGRDLLSGLTPEEFETEETDYSPGNKAAMYKTSVMPFLKKFQEQDL